VTGVSDLLDDGDVAFSSVTAPVISTDSSYSMMNAADAAVPNLDDDAAGVTVTAAMGLAVTQAAGAGNQATFTMVMTAQPTANTSFSLASIDTTEAIVSPRRWCSPRPTGTSRRPSR
jgi:hypothetical protein